MPPTKYVIGLIEYLLNHKHQIKLLIGYHHSGSSGSIYNFLIYSIIHRYVVICSFCMNPVAISQYIKISRISRYSGNLSPALNCSWYTVVYPLGGKRARSSRLGELKGNIRGILLILNGRELTITDI